VKIDPDTLRAIEAHFYDVIRHRVGDLVTKEAMALPELGALLPGARHAGWFPVPGMYGGFKYWWEGGPANPRLIVESWSRIAEGSGQRHVVTADGPVLVDEGFV
jgi:hypothetical protein